MTDSLHHFESAIPCLAPVSFHSIPYTLRLHAASWLFPLHDSISTSICPGRLLTIPTIHAIPTSHTVSTPYTIHTVSTAPAVDAVNAIDAITIPSTSRIDTVTICWIAFGKVDAHHASKSPGGGKNWIQEGHYA